MFRKLISNLPFSPSLIYQVALYSKQLKRESRIRGIGLAFLTAAVTLQCLGLMLLPVALQGQPGTTKTANVLGAQTGSPIHNQDGTKTYARGNGTQTVNEGLFPQISNMHGLLLSFGFIGIVSYFYSRNRLLAKELDIVKTSITSNGGT